MNEAHDHSNPASHTPHHTGPGTMCCPYHEAHARSRDLTLPQPDTGLRIEAVSVFSARTRQPIVEIHLGEIVSQVAPEVARQIGLMLIEVAEASEQDANLWRFLTGTGRLGDRHAAQMLAEFRALRTTKQRAEAGNT